MFLVAPSSHVAGADVLVLLPPHLQSLLLKSASGWGELQDLLGLTPLNNSQLMVKLLLPQLIQLPQPYPETLLAALLRGWGRYKATAELVEVLGDIPFVPARGEEEQQGDGGCLKGCYRPRELFDPQQPLFDRVFAPLMAVAAPSGFGSSNNSSTAAAAGAIEGVDALSLPQPRFPASPYDSPAWLAVLRDLGLISQVTPGVFLTLVQLVAKWAAETAAAAGSDNAMAVAAAGVGVQGRSSSRVAVASRLSRVLPAGVVDLGGCDGSSQGEVTRVCDLLLNHLKSHYHGWGVGGDRGWWEALGGVPWVPATFGIPGEKGGVCIWEGLQRRGWRGSEGISSQGRLRRFQSGCHRGDSFKRTRCVLCGLYKYSLKASSPD